MTITFERYCEVRSTNSTALELRVKGCAEGTVVLAERQTTGRGQQGTTWESEAGKNLTMSLVLYPDFLPAGRIFYLSKIVSLGVCDYLRSEQIAARIKWPNDIYVGDNKVCGILMEQGICAEMVAYSVVGIGLNVNQRTFLAAPNGISMYMVDGIERSIGAVSEKVAEAVGARYETFKQGGGSLESCTGIDAEYRSLLYRGNGYFPFRASGETFTARIADVAADGRITLQSAHGSTRSFGFKEVEFVLSK